MENLEEKIYECLSISHIDVKRRLNVLRYPLNGHISPYYVCEPCGDIYVIKNGTLEYVDTDDIENLPIFLKEDGNLFDPMDVIEGEAD